MGHHIQQQSWAELKALLTLGKHSLTENHPELHLTFIWRQDLTKLSDLELAPQPKANWNLRLSCSDGPHSQ